MLHIWGRKRNAYTRRIFVINTDRKKSLEIPRRRWDYNIKMDLRGIGWNRMDWIDVAEDGE
jgi:hypothetical protein